MEGKKIITNAIIDLFGTGMDIDFNLPYEDTGLDSMSLFMILNEIENISKIRIHVNKLNNINTLNKLSIYLDEFLN